MTKDALHTATDKRVERSKQAVLIEVYRQLTQSGIGGVSVDEVSRRSGVAKTTIYRHWPSRSALLLEACSQIGVSPAVPDTGTLTGDLRMLTHHLAEELRTAPWPFILPSIIDAAERDPEIAAVHAALHHAMMAAFSTAIERAHTRGELPVDHDNASLVAAIVGPLFYRRWFSKEPLDDSFVDYILNTLVNDPKI